MTAASLRFAAFCALAAIGLIVHAAAEARRDRIARDKAQGKRMAANASRNGLAYQPTKEG